MRHGGNEDDPAGETLEAEEAGIGGKAARQLERGEPRHAEAAASGSVSEGEGEKSLQRRDPASFLIPILRRKMTKTAFFNCGGSALMMLPEMRSAPQQTER